MIWVETPTNPLLKLVDLGDVAEIARRRGILTRRRQHLRHALRASGRSSSASTSVVHSATKYLNGHSDMVGGVAVVVRRPTSSPSAWLPAERGRRDAGPFDSFLALRGLKTLALRMERHCQNAAAHRRMAGAAPKVERVYYPGLASHPQHALAKRQMRGFGGMVTAVLEGGLERRRRFLERCRALHARREPRRRREPDRASRRS